MMMVVVYMSSEAQLPRPLMVLLLLLLLLLSLLQLTAVRCRCVNILYNTYLLLKNGCVCVLYTARTSYINRYFYLATSNTTTSTSPPHRFLSQSLESYTTSSEATKLRHRDRRQLVVLLVLPSMKCTRARSSLFVCLSFFFCEVAVGVGASAEEDQSVPAQTAPQKAGFGPD